MPSQSQTPFLEKRVLQRINVVGTSGVGKTTFASRLAQTLAIPYVEMDALFWQPNWTETPDEAFFAKLAERLRGESWVLDGNYSRTTPIKWKRVQTVIWLDYPFLRTLTQAVWRAASRAWTGEELWPGTGNRESFRQSFFSRESIILWTLKTYHRRKKTYAQLTSSGQYPNINFIRLRSRRQSQFFLEQLARE